MTVPSPQDAQRVQCPTCGDVHSVEDRDEQGGERLCPECGDPTATVIDAGELP